MARADVTVEEADSLIAGQIRPFPTEGCGVEASAGRFLREDILADRDFPPFDRVALDGIALAYAALERGEATFTLQATVGAGQPRVALLSDRHCIEVMTGGILPEGADCVVPIERVERFAEIVAVRPGAAPRRMGNVSPQASECRAGTLLIHSGTQLRSTHVAICAAVGKRELAVAASPSIALASTGDELVEIDRTPEPFRLRISNRYAAQAALKEAGYLRTSALHLPDAREPLRERLAAALVAADLLITSGGASIGKFDHLPAVLAEVGVECLFRGVRERPGLSFWFGVTGEGKPVFALSGSPVSAQLLLHRFVLPYLAACSGAAAGEGARVGASASHPVVPGALLPAVRESATLAEEVEGQAGLTLFVPVTVAPLADGRLAATPCPTRGSGDLTALGASDGFLELPPGAARFAAGTAWPLYRW